MVDKKILIRNIKIVVICAVVFFCMTMPFHLFVALTNLTEVRPAAALPPVCGLLFGFWGALGCALGNFIADLVCGYNIAISIISFFVQVVTSYMFYVMWYGQFVGDEKTKKAQYPSLNKVSNVVRFCLCICISALFTAVMIGCLLKIFDSGDIFSNTTIIIFFNNVIFGILFGLPLTSLLTKSKVQIIMPQPPKKEKNKKTLVLLSNFFLVLFMLSVVFCVAYRIFCDNVPVIMYIGAIVFVWLGLLIKPLKSCDDIVRKTGTFSINEEMIFNFTFVGIALTVFLGIMNYMRLQELGYNGVELWERLYLWISYIIIFYFIIAILTLRYMEKNITLPISKISEVASKYDTDNYTESSALITEECRKLAKHKNEIGAMSKSIERMITDIGIYTEDIKTKTAERQRMVAELDIASKIQLGIVPHNFEDFMPMGAEIFADMVPAKMVGGDFYDFFRIDDSKIGIVIGDVSGKGVPAALFMSMTKMLIEMFLMEGKTTAEALTLSNKYLCEHNSADMFVTVLAAVYDTQSGELSYSNAGHNPPIVCQNDICSFLKLNHGLMLGSLDFVVYKEEKMILNNNDMLFLYTDGVTEANNKEQTLFGEEKLLDVLNQNINSKAEEIVNTVKKSVNSFSEGMEQFDDMTMVLMRVRRKI